MAEKMRAHLPLDTVLIIDRKPVVCDKPLHQKVAVVG